MPTAPSAVMPVSSPGSPTAPTLVKALVTAAGSPTAPALVTALVTAAGSPTAPALVKALVTAAGSPTAPARVKALVTVAGSPTAPGAVQAIPSGDVTGLSISGDLYNTLSESLFSISDMAVNGTLNGRDVFTVTGWRVSHNSTQWVLENTGIVISSMIWTAAAGSEETPDLADWTDSADGVNCTGEPAFALLTSGAIAPDAPAAVMPAWTISTPVAPSGVVGMPLYGLYNTDGTLLRNTDGTALES